MAFAGRADVPAIDRKSPRSSEWEAVHEQGLKDLAEGLRKYESSIFACHGVYTDCPLGSIRTSIRISRSFAGTLRSRSTRPWFALGRRSLGLRAAKTLSRLVYAETEEC